MKMIFMLLSFLLIHSPAWSQEFAGDDQYPETDQAILESGEFNHPRGLPSSDFEDSPREEQEYIPDPSLEEMTPEEIYEADEEYLE